MPVTVGPSGKQRRDSLPRSKSATELESERRRCLELSSSGRANGVTEHDERRSGVNGEEVKTQRRRAGSEKEEVDGEAEEEERRRRCATVGWRRNEGEEEEVGARTEGSLWHQLQRGQEGPEPAGGNPPTRDRFGVSILRRPPSAWFLVASPLFPIAGQPRWCCFDSINHYSASTVTYFN